MDSSTCKDGEVHDRNILVTDAEKLVREHMSRYDPSHDWFHVDRVRRTAKRLARQLKKEDPNAQVDEILVELIALFHDMAAKYTSESAPSLETTLEPVLGSSCARRVLSQSQKIQLFRLIPLISWSTEKKLRAAGQWDQLESTLKQEGSWWTLACVQDADRLDAVGAFGILRVAAYSSAVNRPLHVPLSTSNSVSSPDQHEALVAASSIQHFHDKLLLIKDRLKTPLGKQEGIKRHQTMLDFLDAIEDEISP